jgi:hypothetical protein
MTVKCEMAFMKRIKIMTFLLLAVGGWSLNAMDVEFPLIQSMSYFPYSDHHTLFKNHWRFSLNTYYSNIYMFDHERTTVNDMETLSTTLALGYGLTGGITLEVYYRFIFAFGGLMDGLIVNFHDLFGLSEGGRNEYPRNEVNYRYKDVFSYENNTTGQSPLIFGVLGKLYQEGNFYLNGRIALGLPVSSKPGFSSNKPFITVGLILLYKGKNFSIDFSNHVSLFKNPHWLAAGDLKKRVFHSEIRVNYRRLFGGFLYKSTPFPMNDLSNGAYQVYIGYKIWKYFELSLVEEFPPMDTTPDVSFNLKIKLGPRSLPGKS